MHSTEEEKRNFLFGLVGRGIVTVWFTVRKLMIRIFGAGFWREGRERYEKENDI